MNSKESLRFLEILDSLEKQRKSVKILTIISLIPVSLPFILLLSEEYKIYASYSVYLSFFLTAGLLLFTGNKRKVYNKQFKKNVIQYCIDQFFDDVKYYPDYGIDEHTVFSSSMIVKGNYFESEDLITGTYKNVPFSQSDVRIQHRQAKSSFYKRLDIFTGRWMVFKFNKNFVCNLQVSEKGFFGYKKGKDVSGERLYSIKLENEAFNREFRVNCKDIEEAYYILTPQMMDRMLVLREKTKGKLMFCFMNNSLHIALNNGKNSFEAPVFKRIDLQDIVKETYEDLALITDFVNSLNLDNKLFKM